MPYSLRSIAVSRVSPRRSRPNGSTLGAAASRPCSSTGFVTPLIVSSAVPLTAPSSPRESVSARKAISGFRSASKKSGDWRWPESCSSFTSTLATRAEPARVEPSSVASKSRKLPRKMLTPAYSTSNATFECTGSAVQMVPAGAMVVVDSRVLI